MPTATGSNSRIAYLDGMRCIAVVAVMCRHYFSRWTPPSNPESLYPYGGVWSQFLPFKYGTGGVYLFFIISGFVISLTLERCRSPWEFAVRRYARLAPAMLIFSVLTYLAEIAIPNSPFHSDLSAFASSVTFLDPRILNILSRSTHRFSSIDGAYWSLYVEVKYYVLVCALYFFNRAAFARNMVLVSSLVVLGYACTAVLAPRLSAWIELLLFPELMPWFVLGVGFYLHFTGAATRRWAGVVAAALLQFCCISYHYHAPWALAAPALLAGFFLAAMHSRVLQGLLGTKPLVTIGTASYGLYLLHENVGVAAIHALPNFFRMHPAAGLAAALLTMIGCALIAYLSFVLVEKPANRRLTTLLLGARQQGA